MRQNKPTAIVFGVGEGYIFRSKYIHDFFDVIALVDNDVKKHGSMIDGMKIYSPDVIKESNFDYVLITAKHEYSLDIKKQLEALGVSTCKMRFHGEGGMPPFAIDPLFFADDLSECQKKKLFSENMERVLIEVNSKCNRKCWFCTNSILGDIPDNENMTDEVFDKILGELAEIDYDKEVWLSFFNEPLLCTKLIERIRKIKSSLPKCYIYMFSNGDYLTKESLAQLADAGLDMLAIDIYINKFDCDPDEAHELACKLLKRINVSMEFTKSKYGMYGLTCYGDMDIEIIFRDFTMRASNRAESLPESLPIPKITSHPLPCIKSFFSFHVDFRGNVWPCPNYHREFAAHKKYCVGNVLDQSIFDIYLGEKLNNYREQNFFHRDNLPCRSCIWNFNSFITNRLHRPFRCRPSKK